MIALSISGLVPTSSPSSSRTPVSADIFADFCHVFASSSSSYRTPIFSDFGHHSRQPHHSPGPLPSASAPPTRLCIAEAFGLRMTVTSRRLRVSLVSCSNIIVWSTFSPYSCFVTAIGTLRPPRSPASAYTHFHPDSDDFRSDFRHPHLVLFAISPSSSPPSLPVTTHQEIRLGHRVSAATASLHALSDSGANSHSSIDPAVYCPHLVPRAHPGLVRLCPASGFSLPSGFTSESRRSCLVLPCHFVLPPHFFFMPRPPSNPVFIIAFCFIPSSPLIFLHIGFPRAPSHRFILSFLRRFPPGLRYRPIGRRPLFIFQHSSPRTPAYPPSSISFFISLSFPSQPFILSFLHRSSP